MPKYQEDRRDQTIVTKGRTLDHVAKIYDLLSPLMTFYQEKRFSKKAIGLLGLKGEESVLDVGCGTGSLTLEIARKLSDNSLVVGLDAAPKMIEVATKKAKDFKNIRFDFGIAENLAYEDDSFHCVVSSFFFHHVNFDLKKRSLNEIWRVLKENGRAVIVDVDVPTNLLGSFSAWAGYWLFQQDEIRENIKGKLRQIISESKFRSWYQASHHLGYISIYELSK